MAGLSGCLARLEARVHDVGLARMARRQAGDGVTAAAKVCCVRPG